MTRYELNNEFKGIEIYFDSKPTQAVINTLKSDGWRWHGLKKCWYAKQSNKTIETAEKIINGGSLEVKEVKSVEKSKKVSYKIQVSDYITKEEFTEHCKAYYNNQYRSESEAQRCVEHAVKEYYTNDSKYYNLTQYIRHAIVWKSLGRDVEKFQCNGENVKYSAIWDKLPTIEGLKATDKKYSAIWGYDQTQITTATYYGKAFGLDVLITGGYGSGEVLLKRISKDGSFSERCMYFTPNRFTEEEIRETNEYVAYHGR